MGGFISSDELREIECSLENRAVFRKMYNYSKMSYILFAIFIIMFIYQFI
jgi:hypothetical protein